LNPKSNGTKKDAGRKSDWNSLFGHALVLKLSCYCFQSA
jgi:hypothetical protein